MMDILAILYTVCAVLLALYTSGQVIILFRFWRTYRQTTPTQPITDYPTVTIQLPLYNEQYVAQRLIHAVAQLDYPHDKLWIQILDDSSDNTSQVVAQTITDLQAQGIQIQHIQRTERTGYKAGALAHGLTCLHTDYVAIFDADFIPSPDFLQQTLPHLIHNPKIGVVQTRWGHLNADANWLTRAQKLSIDTHFVIEQTARNRSGWLIPFNGTGGVWRRACIDAAGGWSADTLTEDLDLSYRAQMQGWQSLILPDIEVPGEIPPQLAAYKQQQTRWAMGNTQCLIKLAKPVVRARLTLPQKTMAIHHLCQYLPHPLMLMLLLLTPPLLLTNNLNNVSLAPLGIMGLAPPTMYIVGQMRLHDNWLSQLKAFPVLLFIGTGISLSNTLAVIGAFSGVKREFRRTPKFVQDWASNRYALRGGLIIWFEFALVIYALWGAWLAWRTQRGLVIYLLIYALSFATVAIWTLHDAQQIHRMTTHPHST
jgi:cellulose synthase/poly-beta-1,6-N-acetylglucosamine synthase-like glycosyltransferase